MLSYVNEGLGDTIKAVIGSPVKFIKIKNNLKEWAKSKLDIAAVEMDAIRKKEAAKSDPKGIDKEKLTAATKSKKEAINGKMKAIEDRLKELATTDSLRAVVSLGKTKASLEANKKLLKIANQEELSALKIKIEDQIEKEQETITNIEDKLKKYSKDADAKDSESTSKEKDSESTSKEKDSESTSKEKDSETNTGNSKQSKIKKDKTDSKDDSTGNGSSKEDSIKDDSTEDGSSKEFSKGQLKALKQIERYKKAIQDLIDNAKEDKVNVKDNAKRAQDAEEKLINVKKSGNEEEIKKAQDELTDARDGLDAAQRRKQEAENTIDNNRKEINKLIKDNDLDPKLKESFNELYNSYLLIINEGLDNSVNNTSENSNSKIELSNDIAAKFREAMKRLK